MRRTYFYFRWIVAAGVLLFGIGVLLPSLIGLLLVTMLAVLVTSMIFRRRQQREELFNSTLRTVCRNGGEVQPVAIAFSGSGPLSGKFYEYSRRLMMGQDPIEAATKSNVQLELGTAIAMQISQVTESTSSKNTDADTNSQAIQNSTDRYDAGLSVADDLSFQKVQASHFRGQLIYLSIAAIFTSLVITFCSLFILPSMEQTFQEFGIVNERFLTYRSNSSLILLGLFAFVLTMLIMLVPAGINPFANLIGRMVNLFPKFAERRSHLLHGIADAIDAGWPIGKALTIAHMISLDSSERSRLQMAMEWIEQGKTPIESIEKAGWIDTRDTAWLDSAPPSRMAETLRTIGDGQIRDAIFNLGWIMQTLYPVCLGCLALIVGWFCYAFIEGLYTMVTQLSLFR